MNGRSERRRRAHPKEAFFPSDDPRQDRAVPFLGAKNGLLRETTGGSHD
jgi:hypothetical protein